MIVMALVSSSIMMLPYCKSLWQNPISCSLFTSCSSKLISSSMLSRPNSFECSFEHKFLACPTQVLSFHVQVDIYFHLNKTVMKMNNYNFPVSYLILSQMSTLLSPGMCMLWNLLSLDATRADMFWSRRSVADSVWNQIYTLRILLVKKDKQKTIRMNLMKLWNTNNRCTAKPVCVFPVFHTHEKVNQSYDQNRTE